MMAAVAAWGGPDIVVNNAGIQRTVSLADATRQVWDDIIASIFGCFHTMRHALPGMGDAVTAASSTRFGARAGALGQQGTISRASARRAQWLPTG